MELILKEPLSPRYIYIAPNNVVHVLMPVVGGTSIGLDNTCKAVYGLQEFFGKGTNSNKKATLQGELLTYKGALESDLSLLEKNTELSLQKQSRLAQINTYLEVVKQLERSSELACLNSGFPSYPRALEALMQDRTTSNLYSIILRPTAEDGYLRSEGTNPVFSVAHRSVARGIEESPSTLQQALIKAYEPLRYEARDLKSQVMEQVSNQLTIPVNFTHLIQILQQTVEALMQESVDFTKTQQGAPLTQGAIDASMGLSPQTATPEDYVESLLGYCAPNLFDTANESPFYTLTQTEHWSIATQFLLGIINIHALSQGYISPDTNFGSILDKSSDLSKELAQTLVQGQKDQACIEELCIAWMNAYANELKLKKPFDEDDLNTIKDTFATLYSEIKDSPHFDEFFILNKQKKGNFVIHQASICAHFAEFACSPLFELPKNLTEMLATPQTAFKSLSSVEIPHQNPEVQASINLDLSSMNDKKLQALYDSLNTYKDSTIKEQLLTQFKQERPDFKPKIDAKHFLQQVAYGQQDEAETLLKKDHDFAQELLTARKISFTDYSGRTFKCSAYEYAYWAKDTHMCRMLEKYMNDNTKQELLKRVQKIEGPTGPEFTQKSRGLAYTDKNGVEHRSTHFDLTPLKKAIKDYIDTYNKSPKQSSEDWAALDALWIKVGVPQRDVPAHVAQEYCHPDRSFYDISQNPGLLDASNPNNLKRQLKCYNYVAKAYDAWFTVNSYSTDSGLGSSFAILRTALQRGYARAWGVGVADALREIMSIEGEAIEAIDKTRTEDLKQSLANLELSSSLRAAPSRGS